MDVRGWELDSFATVQATLEALKAIPLTPAPNMVVKHAKYRNPSQIHFKLLMNCHWAHSDVQNGCQPSGDLDNSFAYVQATLEALKSIPLPAPS